MNSMPTRDDGLAANIFGGLNKRLLHRTIQYEHDAFARREEERAQKLQEQQTHLEYSDYLSLLQ